MFVDESGGNDLSQRASNMALKSPPLLQMKQSRFYLPCSLLVVLKITPEILN